MNKGNKTSPRVAVAVVDPLENWQILQVEINRKNEAELWELLEREKKGDCRRTFVTRLFGRANKLRAMRELGELNKLITARELVR